jgi:hypothetical protein
VAATLLVWALLEAFVDHGPGPLAGCIAFAVAISVPLAFRRQAPGVRVKRPRWRAHGHDQRGPRVLNSGMSTSDNCVAPAGPGTRPHAAARTPFGCARVDSGTPAHVSPAN